MIFCPSWALNWNKSIVIAIVIHKRLLFCLKSKCCKQHKAACHHKKCDIINDIKLFLTGYNIAIV